MRCHEMAIVQNEQGLIIMRYFLKPMVSIVFLKKIKPWHKSFCQVKF